MDTPAPVHTKLLSMNKQISNRRSPDGNPAACLTAYTMRLLDSPTALLILTAAAAAIVASDERKEEGNAAADDGEATGGSTMCSGGVVGSAGSVAVRGADGRLATHTLIDVSGAAPAMTDRHLTRR